MPRITAPALESVVRTLYRDRLPPHVEVSVERDPTTDSLDVRLYDQACSVYAVARIDRQALRSYDGDRVAMVDMIAHEIESLVERLRTAREGAVRQALTGALGALADATEIVVGTGRSADDDYGSPGEGRVMLRHRESGAARECMLEPTPGGLPAWAEQIVRLYRYQVEQQPSRAHLFDGDETIADMLLRMCATGVYVPPSPLHALEHHREVAYALYGTAGAVDDLLDRYIDDCGRLLDRARDCTHEWAAARWDGRDHYVETCSRCGATSTCGHHHTEARGVHPVEGYGEVDLDCQGCRRDAAKVPAVMVVFKATAKNRFERELKLSETTPASAPLVGPTRFERTLDYLDG